MEHKHYSNLRNRPLSKRLLYLFYFWNKNQLATAHVIYGSFFKSNRLAKCVVICFFFIICFFSNGRTFTNTSDLRLGASRNGAVVQCCHVEDNFFCSCRYKLDFYCLVFGSGKNVGHLASKCVKDSSMRVFPTRCYLLFKKIVTRYEPLFSQREN